MKQSKIVAVMIVIAVIAIIVVITGSKNSQNEPQRKGYSRKLENGVVINTSEKLSETKTYKGLEFTNIKLKSIKSVTSLTADIKNVSSNKTPEQVIGINVLDDQGNVITYFKGVIKELEPGQTTNIDAGIASDYANAYNIEIVEPK